MCKSLVSASLVALLQFTCWFGPSARAAEPVAAPAEKLPNIVLILADDLGWGDLGCYGHPYARTPHLDRLASEGTRFLQFYATGVTCCPARTGLMTGKLPATFARYPAEFGFGERVTVTELLHERGYATGHFGKWHIGTELAPGTYGIDEIGHDAALAARRDRTAARGRDAHLFDAAIEFIERHRDGPFYVNVWAHITHHPVDPQQRFVDEFADIDFDERRFSVVHREKFDTVRQRGGDVDDALRRYLGDVFSLDRDVGRLLARLDELGLSENTIVVFNSDQGPPSPQHPKPRTNARQQAARSDSSAGRPDPALNLLGYAGPLFRGGKHTDLEGGVRTPFIVRWPGHVPAGRVDGKSVLSGADWLPSLCAIAGIAIDAGDFDGEDSSSAWLGGSYTRSRPLFWKTNSDTTTPAMRWRNWKLHAPQRRGDAAELYDLASDPGEAHDVAAQQPEVLDRLGDMLATWWATLPQHYEHGAARDE